MRVEGLSQSSSWSKSFLCVGVIIIFSAISLSWVFLRPRPWEWVCDGHFLHSSGFSEMDLNLLFPGSLWWCHPSWSGFNETSCWTWANASLDSFFKARFLLVETNRFEENIKRERKGIWLIKGKLLFKEELTEEVRFREAETMIKDSWENVGKGQWKWK